METMFKQHGTIENVSDQKMRNTLSRLNFSNDEIDSVFDDADRFAQWGTSSKHLCAVASRLLVNTWAAVDRKPGVFCSGKGCMAGVPKADIIFVLVVSRLNKKSRGRMFADGLITRVDCRDVAGFFWR